MTLVALLKARNTNWLSHNFLGRKFLVTRICKVTH